MAKKFIFNRKPGWVLNPNDKILSNIVYAIQKNNGECPCHHIGHAQDRMCPCKEYLENDKCHCSLYLKIQSN